jgi:hypothetical protein
MLDTRVFSPASNRWCAPALPAPTSLRNPAKRQATLEGCFLQFPHPWISAVEMIVDMPIGEIQRRLQSISNAVFKLVAKIEFARTWISVSAAVELPRDSILEFKFALRSSCDLIRECEVAFGCINRMD